MKHISKIMKVSLLLALVVVSARAEVVFEDDFETQPLGDLGTSVPIGGGWHDGTPADISEFVVAPPAPVLGTQSLKVVRDTDAGQFPALIAQSLSGSATPGYSITYRWDIYRATDTDAPEVYVSCGAGSMAGWMVENAGETTPDGNYWIQNNGIFESTSLHASVNAWDSVEMVVHLVADDPNHLGGSYDFYVTQDGVRTQLAAGYDLVSTTTNGIAYTTIHGKPQMTAAPNIVHFDNISIEKNITVVPPVCGDSEHPIRAEDLNGDCRVNLADLAVMQETWMDCSFDCGP